MMAVACILIVSWLSSWKGADGDRKGDEERRGEERRGD